MPFPYRHRVVSRHTPHGPTAAQLRGRRRWGATSNHRGVYRTDAGTYAAKVRVDGRLRYLGTYRTEALAAAAVAQAYRRLAGGEGT